ncbi:MAG: hypothetical protein KBS59_06720 [Clostridiales bacterium]|nr:hypothetical protein [Clostridiales bacterium]
MKFAVIQPHYSFDASEGEKCFEGILSLLDECDTSLDVIVLPEYSDIPYDEKDLDKFDAVSRKNNAVLLEKAKATATRCGAKIFCNCFDFLPSGKRNTTFVFDERGECVGKYYKAHPAPSEVRTKAEGGHGLDVSYSYDYAKPYVIELDGVRYGFLTCYDFYFYENFARIARENVDVIIGCSLQRTDTHSALEIIGRFLCYNTNAYLVRASVSLGADSEICGSSMIVAPNGDVVFDMHNDVGIRTAEIDPHKKYYKAAGFMGPKKAHYEYIEEGRRPWLYRPAGSMMIPNDKTLPYPRICAHRGFSTIAPENSLPAFGAAVALGADEIEFDLWATKDEKLVSIHDDSLDRVSNGKGKVYDYTYDELKKLDFGAKHGEHFEGLQIITFEEILKKFACTTIMNIHVKIWDYERENRHYEEIASLLREYGCADHAYIMTVSNTCLEEFHKIAPEICRC